MLEVQAITLSHHRKGGLHCSVYSHHPSPAASQAVRVRLGVREWLGRRQGVGSTVRMITNSSRSTDVVSSESSNSSSDVSGSATSTEKSTQFTSASSKEAGHKQRGGFSTVLNILAGRTVEILFPCASPNSIRSKQTKLARARAQAPGYRASGNWDPIDTHDASPAKCSAAYEEYVLSRLVTTSDSHMPASDPSSWVNLRQPRAHVARWCDLGSLRYLGCGEFCTAHQTTLWGEPIALKMLKEVKSLSHSPSPSTFFAPLSHCTHHMGTPHP